MDSKEFKVKFGEIAKENDFKQAFGGWYKESDDCLAVLELQKSNYSDFYNLNIKIFVKKIFGRIYQVNKDLIKAPSGHITKQIINDTLALDKPMENDIRKNNLQKLFIDQITPFVNSLIAKSDILDLERKGDIKLLPTVKKELEQIIS